MTASQREFWGGERLLDYHRRQYETPYRSTVALGEVVRETLPDPAAPMRAIDVGCGGGANIHYLRTLLPNTTWLGVDFAPETIALARRAIAETGGVADVEFVEGDFNALGEFLPARSFDLVFSIQTLSWLATYEHALEELLGLVAPAGHAFITSLFTDFRVDVRSDVTLYDEESFERTTSIFYNVYSVARFAAECRRLGAARVDAIDFDIDRDLAPPENDAMGTYTHRLDNGRRLQFSGPLLLPWKFVVVGF
jgi:ubiquinone/menaquinone biosynthesis C-methylase UbiE